MSRGRPDCGRAVPRRCPPSRLRRLDATLGRRGCVAITGVRPVEQGEGDSFVIAFTRASDVIACALEFQRAPLAPIRLRIGLHTGEVQLRDERTTSARRSTAPPDCAILVMAEKLCFPESPKRSGRGSAGDGCVAHRSRIAMNYATCRDRNVSCSSAIAIWSTFSHTSGRLEPLRHSIFRGSSPASSGGRPEIARDRCDSGSSTGW